MSVSSSQPSEDRFGKTLFVAISQLMIISYLCLLCRNSELGCTACLLGRGLDGTRLESILMSICSSLADFDQEHLGPRVKTTHRSENVRMFTERKGWNFKF